MLKPSLPGLSRPRLDWPGNASLVAYDFTQLIVTALNQGPFISYTGWYVDDPSKGPIWHRLPGGDEGRLVVALVAAVYSLWIGGKLSVLSQEEKNERSILLAASGSPHPDLPLLEKDLLSALEKDGPLRPSQLVKTLPLPSKRRGIGAWFFTGTPEQQKQGKRGWFSDIDVLDKEGADWVRKGLGLSDAFVVLEAGLDLADDAGYDERDEVTYDIETQILDAVTAAL